MYGILYRNLSAPSMFLPMDFPFEQPLIRNHVRQSLLTQIVSPCVLVRPQFNPKMLIKLDVFLTRRIVQVRPLLSHWPGTDFAGSYFNLNGPLYRIPLERNVTWYLITYIHSPRHNDFAMQWWGWRWFFMNKSHNGNDFSIWNQEHLFYLITFWYHFYGK